MEFGKVPQCRKKEITMSLQQIEQWRKDRLMHNGAWEPDTIDCIIYGMEARQPCSVLHQPTLENLYEYKRLVEIGCEFLADHPDQKRADMLNRAIRVDAQILWKRLGGQMHCNPIYSEHALWTVGLLFQCLQMTEERCNAVKNQS